MSFKWQIYETRLTLSKNVFPKNCDGKLIIILCVLSSILPIIRCAKLENPQIRLLINDDDLLQEKSNLHERGGPAADDAIQHDKHSGEHFNLYPSELKRLSYETIHRILRDENEPSYRREETEMRYYQKRSPSFEENHQLMKRSTTEKSTELNLSRRNLAEFLFTSQTLKLLNNVSVLNLANNYLSNINIARLDNITSLLTLNLQNNSFTSIPLSRETSLLSLNLNNNFIRSSNLSANIYLRNLFLAGNRIENLSSIPLAMLKNLECLDLSNNLLTTISEASLFMERMHNLKDLNLAYNHLGCIYRETFYNLLSLNTLLLSHNNITDIDYETFLALPNLQFLDLSFNNLQGKSIRALQGLTGLVALNIAFNSGIGGYMQEFVASWSLKELDASGTGLCQIPAALAQSVRSLKLTHNWLKVINCGDLDSYPLLQYLDLSFSHIEYIQDDALGRLEILEILMLDHNKLRKIPFSLPVSLENLFLQNNEIMEIPQQAFQNLNNLKTLDLSHNKLLYLPDIMLPKLQTLNLQSSEIRGISQGIIHTLPKLNDLMLEDNPIKCSDLLGIAEWASTCRLRAEKEVEAYRANKETEEEQENFVQRIQDLKNKFENMHNYYRKFDWNCSLLNVSTTIFLKEPSCLQENVNSLTRITKIEKPRENKLKPNLIVIKSLKQLNFNLNSKASSANLTNAYNKKIVREQPKKLQTKQTAKTISIESPSKILPAAKQPSSLNRKQKIFLTNPTSFYSSEATTTTNSSDATTGASDSKPFKKPKQNEREMIVQSRTANKMKTLVHLTANADDVSTATTTTMNLPKQQHKFASMRNTPTKSSSNRTGIVEAGFKRTKEAQRKQLEDMQHKTTFPKTFQTTKSKKWLKQDPPLLKPGGKEMIQNMETLYSQSGSINAAQFIKSTTFATLINSKIPATTTATNTLATTTLDGAFIKKNNLSSAKRQEGGAFKEKLVDVVRFDRTRGKLDLNLVNDTHQPLQQQQYEIKTKIATTTEIKFLKAEASKRMQTNKRMAAPETPKTNATTFEPTTRTLPTANLKKGNIELNGFIPPNIKETLTTSSSLAPATIQSAVNKSAIEAKHEQAKTTNKIAATKFQTFKTIEQQKPPAVDMNSSAAATPPSSKSPKGKAITTTLANTTLCKDKHLALNYNKNDSKKHITKTLNETSNILPTCTTTPKESGNNKNNEIARIFDIKNSSEAIKNKDAVDQQQHQLLANMMLHRQLSQRDIIVKCIKTDPNECNSTATTQIPNEFGKMPTIEAAVEQTTASKTSTEISEANETTTTTTSSLAATHKHEPLQLLVKDRHLIGTPLLMHKGENLMVAADELILPTNNHKIENEKNDNNTSNANSNSSSTLIPTVSININNSEHQDLETNTVANVNKYNTHLEDSQISAMEATTEENNMLEDKHKINNSFKQSLTEERKQQQQHSVAKQDDLVKTEKSNYDTKTNKPSLIMKKMTIITKQHEESQHKQLLKPLENEIHSKLLDNSHYQELKPLAVNREDAFDNARKHKQSSINTHLNQENVQTANVLKQPHTFHHEHELLIQQILQDEQPEEHTKLSQSEQWSDLRKGEKTENHPGLILLVSSGLFLVLLLGLMHVYRCDMPWRRHSPTHHMRPHQRHNHFFEDDSHSFLSYSEGMQKWHHSTRLEAPYQSPLHNLHVRELQKSSATEKLTTVKSTITNFKHPPLGSSMALDKTRSLSQSSTTTSTASASSSTIPDDESFYIEMAPDSKQLSLALRSELLPMELLNKTQMPMLDCQETAIESQTSMEDECVVHYQQHQRHFPQISTSALLMNAASSASLSSTIMAGRSLKPPIQPSKFGLW